MSTDLMFYKRKIISGLSCILAFFMSAVFVYAYLLSHAESIYVGKNFYFIISRAAHSEVGIFQTQFDGGAGYVLTMENEECVVISVYLNETEGRAVHSVLTNTGVDCEIRAVSVEALYFKTEEEKNNKAAYIGAFRCLYQYALLLEKEISRLVKGGTQQSCKEFLVILSKQFDYLSSRYCALYKGFAAYCQKIADDLAGKAEKTVYASELRYMLCDLCVHYVDFAGAFAL